MFKVWQPHSVTKTEVYTWAMVEKDMPAELKNKIAKSVINVTYALIPFVLRSVCGTIGVCSYGLSDS